MNRLVIATLIVICAFAPSHASDLKGIGDNGPIKLTDRRASDLSSRISDFNRLGVKWLRLDFDWSDIQPSPNSYNLEGYDRVVRALNGAGIKVLGIIAYTPGWINGGKPTKYYPPVKVSDFAEFAGYLAARYGAMGVHAWEIWNEPNTGQFWGPAADPGAYAALLRAAYTAIRQVNPEAVIVTGGLAQSRNSHTSITALDFLESLYANRAQPYFDAVGNHPYSSPRMPTDPNAANNWQRMHKTISSFRSIMSANGDGSKKVWITEYGAPTYGISAYSQEIVITESQQAKMLKEAYALIPTYSWAGPLFWYQYQDLCGMTASQSTECYYGLIRHDGSRKRAYAEYESAPNQTP